MLLFFYHLFVWDFLSDSCVLYVWLSFGDLADVYVSLSHTRWTNLCFRQQGLSSDIYSCRFLREWCVNEVANDVWSIFIRTSKSNRWCTSPKPEKRNQANGLGEKKAHCFHDQTINQINHLSWDTATTRDWVAGSVSVPSPLINDRLWMGPPALTHIHYF